MFLFIKELFIILKFFNCLLNIKEKHILAYLSLLDFDRINFFLSNKFIEKKLIKK